MIPAAPPTAAGGETGGRLEDSGVPETHAERQNPFHPHGGRRRLPGEGHPRPRPPPMAEGAHHPTDVGPAACDERAVRRDLTGNGLAFASASVADLGPGDRVPRGAFAPGHPFRRRALSRIPTAFAALRSCLNKILVRLGSHPPRVGAPQEKNAQRKFAGSSGSATAKRSSLVRSHFAIQATISMAGMGGKEDGPPGRRIARPGGETEAHRRSARLAPKLMWKTRPSRTRAGTDLTPSVSASAMRALSLPRCTISTSKRLRSRAPTTALSALRQTGHPAW